MVCSWEEGIFIVDRVKQKLALMVITERYFPIENGILYGVPSVTTRERTLTANEGNSSRSITRERRPGGAGKGIKLQADVSDGGATVAGIEIGGNHFKVANVNAMLRRKNLSGHLIAFPD